MTKKKKKTRAPAANAMAFSTPELDLEQKLVLESDRGCVLVAGAAIDDRLVEIIEVYFEKCGAPKRVVADFLEGGLAPLGSNWAKNRMVRALGLVDPPLFKLLELLRGLRNTFAHVSEPVELTDEDIAHLQPLVPWVDKFEIAHSALDKYWRRVMDRSDSKKFSDARRRFMSIITQTNGKLWSIQLKLKRGWIGQWPAESAGFVPLPE